MTERQEQPWRLRLHAATAEQIRDRLDEWSKMAADQLVGDFWPVMPDGVQDRDADVWEALLAVADLAGDRWADDARRAALALVTASRRRQPSLGVLLLRDIKTAFDGIGDDKIPTEKLISALVNMPESPWKTIRKGEPIDPRSLSARLGRYGIGSKLHRIDHVTVVKGYARSQFVDAWKRYVDELLDDDDPGDGSHLGQDLSVTSVTDASADTGVTDVTDPSRCTEGLFDSPGRCDVCGTELAPGNTTGICRECAITNVKAEYGLDESEAN